MFLAKLPEVISRTICGVVSIENQNGKGELTPKCRVLRERQNLQKARPDFSERVSELLGDG
jgi:hypothetical protein